MKNVRIILLLCIVAVVAACSESKSDNDSLSVSAEVINFPAEGGSATFQISCTTSWSVVCDNEAIWLSQTQGKGDCEIEIAMGATTSVKATENHIMVRADNGATRNILIKQAGELLSGTTLSVTNKNIYIAFGGKAHDEDSMMVMTNTSWVLYGPEWLEAYYDGKWVTLSTTTAKVKGDVENSLTVTVKLRTAKALDQIDDVFDELYIKPSYNENMGEKFQVCQLGKHSATPNVSVALAHGMACDWKVGIEVTDIYYKLTKEVIPASEITVEAIQKWKQAKPTTLNSWRNLDANTCYYLYSAGSANGTVKHYNSTYCITPSESNQALAPISNVVKKGDSWNYTVRPGSNCKAYVKLTTTNSTYFDDFDAALAWRINRLMHNDATTNKFPLYSKALSWTYHSPDPLLIVTWGLGQSENRMSGLISRYLTSEHNSAPNRSMMLESDGPDERCEPIDMEEFERSVTIIK